MTPKQENDQALESFERLYDEYYDKVYSYIARRVNNQHDAEDLTAEVFFKAFSNPFDPQIARFSTYVFAIATNTLKNRYRSAAKFIALHSSGPDVELTDDVDALGDLITHEEYRDLASTLAALPDRQYEAVYRRYYLDESFKEIGVAMGVSETNARQLHFQAITKLRECFKKGLSMAPCTSIDAASGAAIIPNCSTS
jgi:RNA polymerase sigma-70 factor (ECF subfamily)